MKNYLVYMKAGNLLTFALLLLVPVIYSIIDIHRFGQQEPGWIAEFPTVGIYSSLRAADLNGDGVKDLIIGTGRLEFQRTDTAVIAVSGATAETLWIVPARDQIFGSAALLDINRDGVSDVLIGGRSAVLMAINGRSGEILWEFFSEGDSLKSSDYDLYNFYNPQIIPDQTGNGLEDILVSNGGDVRVAPHDPDRPPGKLMVIDSATGQLLAHADIPDGKETYMSPVATKLNPDDDDITIIFGSGGETIGGSLFRTTLQDLMNGDISDAEILATGADKGFIAPPVLADLTLNGYYDIVANAVEGKTVAIDGKTNTLLWENSFENVEAYSSLAAGYFTNDSIPDFFTTFGAGTFPQLTNSIQVMLNGSTGETLFLDSLGLAQTSSPVIADFNEDGYDDVLLSVNFTLSEDNLIEDHYTMLVVYDFHNNSTYQLTAYLPGMNLASTPWIGDLNNNGKLDIVYCSLTGTEMNGFRMIRIASEIELKTDVKWGAYMGSRYDGIFR